MSVSDAHSAPARGRALSNGVWSTVLQWSRFGINALVFLLVARFLSLAEIGAFALAFAPVRFLQVLHKNGIADAIIIAERRRGAEEALFGLSLLIAFACSAGLLGAAALVAVLSDSTAPVAPMLAAFAAIPILYGLSAVPEGILRREMRIRALALRTLATQLIAGALTLAAAAAGFGAWSLAVFALVNAALGSVISIVIARWRPHAVPSRSGIKAAAKDSTLISGRVLVSAAVQPGLQIGVGAFLGLTEAGAFQIGQRVLALLDAVALGPIRFLILPAFRNVRDNAARLGGAVLSALHLSGLVSAYIYMGTFAAAPELLTILVGPENAGPSAAILRAFCLIGLAHAASTVLNQALTAAGQTGIALSRSLAVLGSTAVVTLPLFLLGAPVSAIAAAFVAASTTVALIFFRVVPRIFDLPLGAALQAVAAPHLAGLLMAAALVSAEPLFAGQPVIAALFLKIASGTVLYLALTALLARPALRSLRRALTR